MASDGIGRRLRAAAASADGAALAAALAAGLREEARFGPTAGDDRVALVSVMPETWEADLLASLAEPLGCRVRIVPAMQGTTGVWQYAHHVVGTAEGVRRTLTAFVSGRDAIEAAGRAKGAPGRAGRREAVGDELAAHWPSAVASEGLECAPPTWLDDALGRLDGPGPR